jgi:flavin reductase (NADH)/flavin reductase
MSSVDPQQFKAGMRRLAASVCVITTAADDGTRGGLTATAVCSLSADPPTLLVCLNLSSNSYGAVRANGRFAVNVLAADGDAIAQRFASTLPGDDKFDGCEWSGAVTGAPLLSTALAAFDCRLDREFQVGTHAILVGAVAAVRLRDDDPRPLLYASGGYGGFTALDALLGVSD